MKKIIRVGTRKSILAVRQTNLVIEQLKENSPGVDFEIVNITTLGDRDYTTNIKMIYGKGIFVTEIEDALRTGKIDLAVHSLKDLLPETPQDLSLSSIPTRESPYDCLLTKTKIQSIQDLPEHARIGTSSIRRISELKHIRSDIEVVPIRGNLDTRIRKIDEMNLEGIVVAEAGLNRLNPELKQVYRSPAILELIPSAGQGALAIETRKDDDFVCSIVKKIHDLRTFDEVKAERELLASFGGTCNFPVGSFAIQNDKTIQLFGSISSYDGTDWIDTVIERNIKQSQNIASEVYQKLLAMGADRILKEIKENENE
ncbi:hydroxymethylbilane synthase [Pediococcus claussenii]|uniref:Porphobilinogen deaminase n=1 Tax=Pediococcus claussenii (strain ATCC BAA-344 / DSM 14800 / JCM 18046 / KCTC 3811 / LMG 21948 / P06) TaxID=701521 RepID=G8PEN0_PEDCP|nr:hydroxymethylbilane synthase [Pediococcus claussenii]AEV95639.1 porphobilinogen deaminase [Pediococcus claussenii ATCC BAA-344]ANZ69159.1 hydroxymethylbilane synthase [Pediococcus claussenii]ANZ70976.1 hydroxymethylbilane synthase [Pediococcus claussenii]KRN20128.1 hemC protein [Pediococcus claussenii]